MYKKTAITATITTIAVIVKEGSCMQKEIGNVVRFHRKKANLSQQELGRIAGVGKTVVFDLEKGKLSVRFDTILKIIDVLNIKINFNSPLMTLFEESFHEKS